MEKTDDKGMPRRKNFLKRLFEKLDKKIEEKAKSQPCCSGPQDKGKNSCCS